MKRASESERESGDNFTEADDRAPLGSPQMSRRSRNGQICHPNAQVSGIRSRSLPLSETDEASETEDS